MNGTAVMTGLACLAFERAQDLVRLASTISALAVIALKGNPEHYDARLFALKPHAGTRAVAGWIENAIRSDDPTERATSERVQDPYSLRCAPHVIGVLADTLPWIRSLLETELNSANDNPLIVAEEDLVLHGGHFYGGHVAITMDTLKTAVANIADLLDRQFALLVDARVNRGLPPNLSGASAERAAVNHGFKAVQIATSAWTAEALKACMPASVFSRSTECHNQDKVSLGTISARDALRVLELTEQVAAAMLLAAVQGVSLRLESGEVKHAMLSGEVKRIIAAVRSDFAPLVEDRALDSTLRTILARMRSGAYKPAASDSSVPVTAPGRRDI
jgi:histidine ammonia-lyase